MIADGTIVNADINASAAIAHSKLANATAGQVLLGTTTTGVITATTISGDITIDGAGIASIAANSVALGTDTTGNYMSDLTQGTGVTITHTPSEGSNATIAIGQAVGTSASVSFAQLSTSGDLTVGGNLTVNGTTTTLNTETLSIEDNIVVLNSNVTGSPTTNAGIEVERGTSTNVSVRWNETTDTWEFTNDGSAYGNIAALGTIALGTDTTGSYMSDLTQGTGVTITHTPGEGSNATIAIGQAVGTSSSVQFAAVTAPLVGNVTGNASTATTLETSRIIELTGDVTGSVSFNGSANATINATVAANSIALGTDTTGNYVSDVLVGTGLAISHTPGEGSSASVSLNATLDDLNNVSASAPTDGYFLKYLSASSVWIPAEIPTINALDDIGNVSASAPSSGQFLKWNGTAWIAETIIGGATISDSAPASPLAGQLWFDSTVGKTFVYYDSQWIEVGGVGTGARMVSSSSAPASPLEGSMWFDTDTAQTFVYYDSSWVEIGASGITASVQDSAPASPVSGQIWFNSLTGGTYVYYGTNWIEVGASPFSALVNTINTKGDLLVGTADNTIGGLAVGSANQVLTVDSSTATGLKWATPTTYATTGKSIAMSLIFGGG